MDMNEVSKFEQKVGTLKLSEAIRIGSKIRPQGRGGVLRQLEEGTSCALHAAHEAITGSRSEDSSALFHWASMRYGFASANGVVLRNDTFKFTREEIADWLQAQGL